MIDYFNKINNQLLGFFLYYLKCLIIIFVCSYLISYKPRFKSKFIFSLQSCFYLWLKIRQENFDKTLKRQKNLNNTEPCKTVHALLFFVLCVCVCVRVCLCPWSQETWRVWHISNMQQSPVFYTSSTPLMWKNIKTSWSMSLMSQPKISHH